MPLERLHLQHLSRLRDSTHRDLSLRRTPWTDRRARMFLRGAAREPDAHCAATPEAAVARYCVCPGRHGPGAPVLSPLAGAAHTWILQPTKCRVGAEHARLARRVDGCHPVPRFSAWCALPPRVAKRRRVHGGGHRRAHRRGRVRKGHHRHGAQAAPRYFLCESERGRVPGGCGGRVLLRAGVLRRPRCRGRVHQPLVDGRSRRQVEGTPGLARRLRRGA
mmetsp:Transcript_16061/g.46866  ORF Transcript_16061/g.46866 Transcript_16061/m.46866 type:complete len:220 (+) Transcript_16061:401-1060(+)